jgi:hypothetical protein
MDNTHDDMDQAFRDRFNGLRDHSVDPSTAWSSLQSGLYTTSALVSSSTLAGKSLLLKIAASFSSFLIIAGVSVGDRELNSRSNNPTSVSYAQTAFNTKTDNDKSSVNGEDLKTTLSVINQKRSAHSALSLRVTGPSTIAQSAVDLNVTQTNSVSEYVGNTIDKTSRDSRNSDFLSLMPILDLLPTESSLALRSNSDGPTIETWKSNHIVFFKAGVRAGTGESNSFEIDSKWQANLAMSFGYGFSLSDHSYITAEAGWLRRSGNGIERTRSLELNPLVELITESTNGPGFSEEVLIHESLIATQMDYIHLPVSYHRLFNRSVGFKVGGFADYLINAKNEAYIVYNNTQYQSSVIGKTELSSLKGLNRFRYGIVAGIEKSFQNHFMVSCEMMVPLNSAVDDKSEYRVIDNSNKLIDFQLGLTYRL